MITCPPFSPNQTLCNCPSPRRCVSVPPPLPGSSVLSGPGSDTCSIVPRLSPACQMTLWHMPRGLLLLHQTQSSWRSGTMTKSFLSQHLAWCRHIADPKCWVIELVNDQRNEATSAFRNSLRASEEGSEDATGRHPFWSWQQGVVTTGL